MDDDLTLWINTETLRTWPQIEVGKLSANKLAQATAINRQTIARWLKGENGGVKGKNLKAIATFRGFLLIS
jgi:hypothetical protein